MPQVTDQNIRIVGVPMDLGASRRGTDMGPSALRIAGLGARLRHMGYDVAREEDVPVPAMETRPESEAEARYKPQILSVCTQLAELVRDISDAGDFPLVLGGDHSIALGTVAGLAAHHRARDEQLGLIWFDAHADMNVPGSSPSGNVHGMPLAHLLGRGDSDLAGILGFQPKVDPDKVALVGLRDIDDVERETIRASGVHVFTMREIDERGMAAVAREIIGIVTDGTAAFHLSFDVDGCDPEVIPGSGTLVPGGVSYREAHLLMEYCADSGHLGSMEIVELNPFVDQGNVSAERTLHLVQSAMGKSIL